MYKNYLLMNSVILHDIIYIFRLIGSHSSDLMRCHGYLMEYLHTCRSPHEKHGKPFKTSQIGSPKTDITAIRMVGCCPHPII